MEKTTGAEVSSRGKTLTAVPTQVNDLLTFDNTSLEGKVSDKGPKQRQRMELEVRSQGLFIPPNLRLTICHELH